MRKNNKNNKNNKNKKILFNRYNKTLIVQNKKENSTIKKIKQFKAKIANLKIQSVITNRKIDSINIRSTGINLGTKISTIVNTKTPLPITTLNLNKSNLKESSLTPYGSCNTKSQNSKGASITFAKKKSRLVQSRAAQYQESILKYMPVGQIQFATIPFRQNISNIYNKLQSKETYGVRQMLNLLTKFDSLSATQYFEYFQFKQTNKFLFKMEKAVRILNIAFLSMGCFISKPKFNIIYTINSLEKEINLSSEIMYSNEPKTKIIIDLFYFVKTIPMISKYILRSKLYRLSRTFFLRNYKARKNLFNKGFIPFFIKRALLQKKVENIHNKNGILNYKIIRSLKNIFFNLNARKEAYTNLYKTNKYSVQLSKNNLNLSAKSNNLKLLPRNILYLNNKKFSYLIDYLTKLFGVEVEINLIRLYKPYHDSNILVQFLNSASYKKTFARLTKNLFKNLSVYKKKNLNKENINKVAYPSGISGLYIKLAGRPIKERIIPRFTVKRAHRGNLNRLHAKLIEKSMFTDKSRKGAFNFTVTLSHVLN